MSDNLLRMPCPKCRLAWVLQRHCVTADCGWLICTHGCGIITDTECDTPE